MSLVKPRRRRLGPLVAAATLAMLAGGPAGAGATDRGMQPKFRTPATTASITPARANVGLAPAEPEVTREALAPILAPRDEDRVTNINRSTERAPTVTEVFAPSHSVAAMLNPRSEPALERAIGRYETIAAEGGWTPVKVAKTVGRGAKGKTVAAIRHRLAAEGYLPASAAGAAEPFGANDEAAVKGFQTNYGLRVTGKVDAATAAAMSVPVERRLDTLRANLPRVAEYAKNLSGRYILVNIPSTQLEAVEHGRVVSRHNIVVGKPERPSPVVTSTISEINFNPYWNAPKSIVEKDIVPKVRKDARVLRQLDIRIYDGYQGPEVDPDTIDWAAPAAEIAERYHFRQEPGEENAMATVKINFQNQYAVYMHDTPTKNLFEQSQRYFSSGCVRVDKVHLLTDWLLDGQDGWNRERIDRVAAAALREDVQVRTPTEVRWVYMTAWVGADGMAHFRDDIYELDGTSFIMGQPEGKPEETAG